MYRKFKSTILLQTDEIPRAFEKLREWEGDLGGHTPSTFMAHRIKLQATRGLINEGYVFEEDVEEDGTISAELVRLHYPVNTTVMETDALIACLSGADRLSQALRQNDAEAAAQEGMILMANALQAGISAELQDYIGIACMSGLSWLSAYFYRRSMATKGVCIQIWMDLYKGPQSSAPFLNQLLTNLNPCDGRSRSGIFPLYSARRQINRFHFTTVNEPIRADLHARWRRG